MALLWVVLVAMIACAWEGGSKESCSSINDCASQRSYSNNVLATSCGSGSGSIGTSIDSGCSGGNGNGSGSGSGSSGSSGRPLASTSSRRCPGAWEVVS